MNKGVSIHLGLIGVDQLSYGGWDGALTASENDAQAMNDLAVAQGFEPTLLLTPYATSSNLFGALNAAAGKLAAGDFLFVSFSGHGGQFPDTNGDEPDGLDDTWVLYDREVIDDELFGAWASFAAGVRILIVSDSCHSGTIAERILRPRGGAAGHLEAELIVGPNEAIAKRLQAERIYHPKFVPREIQHEYYRVHHTEVKRLEARYPLGRNVAVAASVISLSACKDDQLADDGLVNSLFTAELLNVWQGGQFYDYPSFRSAIAANMPFYETPQLDQVGAANPVFLNQQPLTI